MLSNKSLEINLGSKIYKYIVLFFLVIMFLIILDSYTNQHIMIFFFNILEGIQYEFFEVDNSIVSQILLEYFNRLKTVKDYNLFFYYAGSILILFFYNKKFIKLKNFEFYLLILIIVTTFFHSKHFAPLQKNKNMYGILMV